VNYREAYGMFVSNGILFNHESPIRGETFVTRKITRAVARMARGLESKLYIGNLDAKRDWGHAKDYVEAMWLMLQQEKPDDFVVSTGVTNTVRHFCELAFSEVGVELEFKGQGVEEVGIVKSISKPEYAFKVGQEVIKVDSDYFRPTEVDLLIGDSSKARRVLGWKPNYDLSMLVCEMVQYDLKLN
jgi:GDPmannose 4,6-dehydratase